MRGTAGAESAGDTAGATTGEPSGSYPQGRPLGIVAGGGSLPLEIAKAVIDRGGAVHLVGLGGEVDGDPATRTLPGMSHVVVDWGQIGGLLSALKTAGCRDVLIIGRVRRPDLRKVRPDLGFFLNLATIARIRLAGGDDSVLRMVVRFFEGHGFRVVGVPEVAPRLVAPAGPIAGPAMAPGAEASAAALGFAAISALAPFDVGQGVVLVDGRIVAIEGAEGTDRLMARAGERIATSMGSSTTNAGRTPAAILVKGAKPGQELRVDLPVIGPDTISGAHAAGIANLIIEAGRTIMAEQPRMIEVATALGCGVSGSLAQSRLTASPMPRLAVPRPAAFTLRQASRRGPDRQARAGAGRGLSALAALAPFDTGGATAVVRQHILAIETGEGVASMLDRVAGLRQWGEHRQRRLRGVAVIKPTPEAAIDIARRVRAAGLAGLCLTSDWTDTAAQTMAKAADANGLFAVVAVPCGEEAS